MGYKAANDGKQYTDGPFFVSQSGTTAMAYKKLIQNALLEALHATIVLHHLTQGALFGDA